MTASVNL